MWGIKREFSFEYIDLSQGFTMTVQVATDVSYRLSKFCF